MRGAVAEPILHGFEVKKGRRIARSSPAQRTKTLLSVLDVDALFAHGGQLAPFGHEHDQEHQSRGDNQSEGDTSVSVSLVDHEPTQDPHQPRGDAAADREPYVGGLAVVVPDPAGLDRQHRHEEDQEDDVDEREEDVDVGGAAEGQHCGVGDVFGGDQEPVLGGAGLEGDAVDEGRAREQPLRPDGHLDEDGEEQQQSLVGRREVDAPVQADEEDALHQQRREDDGVGHPRAEAHHRTGELSGRGGVHRPQSGAREQPQQQHLAEEEVAAARGGPPGLAQDEHLEADDEGHGDGGEGEHGDDPGLVAEDAGDAVEAADAGGAGDVGGGGGPGGGTRRHQEELGAHLQAALLGRRGSSVQVAGPGLSVICSQRQRQACRDRG